VIEAEAKQRKYSRGKQVKCRRISAYIVNKNGKKGKGF